MSQEVQKRRVIICRPIQDRKRSDNWILEVKYPLRMRGKIAFPVGFKVDPTKEEYEVEVVEEKPRYLRVKLHTEHVHGKQYSDCCTFECALCGHLFEDCEHPLAKKCLEEKRRMEEEQAMFWEGIEYLAERLRTKMAREIEEFRKTIEEMYEALRNKPKPVAGYTKEVREVCIKRECHDAICPGCWASDEENYCYCVEWGTEEVDVPIPKPDEQYKTELEEWRNKIARPIAEKLVSLLQLFPIKCDSLVYCTDASIAHTDPGEFDPGWVMSALGIGDCMLRNVQDFIAEVLGEEFKNKYFDGPFCISYTS
jgi:hypothetical protein